MEILELTADQQSGLNRLLDSAASLTEEDRPLPIEEVQALYDVALEEFADDVHVKYLVGVAFGEAIVTMTDYEWVRVKDDYGEETSLAPPGLRVVIHPVTIITKRIEKGESIDLRDLRDRIIEDIEAGRDSNKYDKR